MWYTAAVRSLSVVKCFYKYRPPALRRNLHTQKHTHTTATPVLACCRPGCRRFRPEKVQPFIGLCKSKFIHFNKNKKKTESSNFLTAVKGINAESQPKVPYQGISQSQRRFNVSDILRKTTLFSTRFTY